MPATTSDLSAPLASNDGNAYADTGGPSLSKAYDFFLNVTLPRRAKKEDATWRLVEPGQEGGEHYGVWTTGVKDMGEFGIGIGLYFSTLLLMSAAMFLCAIIYSGSISYFRSDDYSAGQDGSSFPGSAVCTEQYTVTTTSGNEVTYNDCSLASVVPVTDLVATAVFFLFLFAMARSQDKVAELFDESQQTAQDYAVCVEDPDADATDPEEWRAFFSQWGHVTYVTVALDNGPLLEALARRRFLELHIEMESANMVDMDGDGVPDDEPELKPWQIALQPYGFFRNLAWYKQERVANRNAIESLRKQHFSASKVFVIFEEEDAQRACLKDLTTGLIAAITDTHVGMADSMRFRGQNVLQVVEPVEPSEVIWHNVHIPLAQRFKEQLASTTLAVGLVTAAFFTLKAIYDSGASGTAAAFFISGLNAALPIVLKLITSVEHHVDAGNLQESMLLKLVVARMATSALLIYIVTPFSTFLDESNISQVFSILIADAITTPTLRLMDAPARLKQWLLAPRAQTQLKMNSYFEGTAWNLAERYTDITKTLAVSLFYAFLFPAGLYVTSAALIVTYWVDKYCLFKRWRQPPALDDSLATTSRGHIVLCLVAHLIVTGQFVAGWSFSEAYLGDDGLYYDVDRYPSSLLWPATEDWMNDTQLAYTKVYRLTALIVLIVALVAYFGETATFAVRKLVWGIPSFVGDSQGKPYSGESDIEAYIPQIHARGIRFPLIATDISTFDNEHISFTGDFQAHCLVTDQDLPGLTNEERHSLFSRVGHYPPAGKAAVSEGDVAVEVP